MQQTINEIARGLAAVRERLDNLDKSLAKSFWQARHAGGDG
jgi:hypothetical protein